MPWEAERLTYREARLLLEGNRDRFLIITDALENATAQLVACVDNKAGQRMMEILNHNREKRKKGRR